MDEVLAALPTEHPPLTVYLADAITLTTEDALVLAVSTQIPAPSEDYEPEEGVSREFRVPVEFVAMIEGNLGIGNMSFEEYSAEAEDGILRY